MINLNDYKSDEYSAGGEDGLIAYLLGTLENRTNFVIEFGAADGFFFSNTAALWTQGCEALLIESDDELFGRLRENTGGQENIETVHALVANIDDFTSSVADVCSIDIDGDDYQVAERMQVRHQIVVIEHNPTVPPHVNMVNIEGNGYGSGAKSLHDLMLGKGYTLVAITKTNMIFLLGDHRDRFVHDVDTLFDRSALNYVVTSYDGGYDYIGEFGYGLSRPLDLRLSGKGMKRRTWDDHTLERLRLAQDLEDRKKR